MKKILQLSLLCLLLTTGLFAQSEEGKASYYSDKYHKTRTYSGELYDKNKLTCAHKSLPMGTLLLVTHLTSGKSVTLRVNDRMSSKSERVLDVSRAAAEELGIIRAGTARVKLQVVEAEEKPEEEAAVAPPQAVAEKPLATTSAEPPKQQPAAKPAAEPEAKPVLIKASDYQPFELFEVALKKPENMGYAVQVAVLSSEDALFKFMGGLQDDWFSSVLVSVQKGKDGNTVYKVLLGSFDTESAAANYRDSLKKTKKMDGFVVDLASLGTEK